jgi:CheY-like chemotaxis protein/HPt (histidine-containing phosphotransfer) domain-containing protein
MKPVAPPELLNAALAVMGIMGREEPMRSPQRSEPSLQPLKILLAEDNVFNQKLAVEMLQLRGHSVTVARTGVKVLSALEADWFDLILMDVQMPDMDGLEAAREIRRQEESSGKHTPIVAMTAHALDGDRERCIEAGMDDYVPKPIRSRALFSAVERAIAQSAAKTAETRASALKPAPSTSHRSRTSRREECPVDWEQALSGFEGNRRLLLMASQGFVDEHQAMLAAVRMSVEAGDAAKLKIAAHTLKGALRYFGQNPAVDLAYRLERMGQNGSLEGAVEVFDLLEDETTGIVSAIERYLRQAVPQG